ncbi:SWIM zinc finger domain-containing protein [Blastopirellula marina]|uniref:SWIM-type domain-containing protein n=1 Tax=Blastopirellula marina TaxID=124 RepID=A0A2S8F9K9_9BACT|nr:SWIM zinc finger family protein [Blastopirellula marina]PQO28837.1 hypothetical protein C5Y98_24025 [Blastopirellula marina]PTL42110.1 SWIM zinc finger family protein [Blastopirellula marina]
MSALLDQFGYHYPFASAANDTGIQLAACDRMDDSDGERSITAAKGLFLQSKLVYPRQTARMLRAVSRVVRTHYYDARPPQLDPIATASRNMLRFEGFSGCCGAYVRLDLDRAALNAEEIRFGTTNVDFNAEMIGHLDRIGRESDVSLDISPESIALEHGGKRVVEKKVSLPTRWMKGLCEVQVYQSRLQLAHRFSPGLIMPLLQQVGRSQKHPSYLTVTAGKPRLSPRATSGAIPVGGMQRLDTLRSILPLLREVHLYTDPDSGVHAWLGESEAIRYWLVLSPELHRGFSGEGQTLSTLATGDWEDRVTMLEDWLAGRSENSLNPSGPAETIDPAEIASTLGWSVADAQATLAALATCGLAGFDAATGYYFQRKLPIDLSRIEKDQPRLKHAARLVAEKAVRVTSDPVCDSVTAEVNSGDLTYFVRLKSTGDTCTCPWFSRHQGDRGPCKHVLAVRILTHREETPQ